MAWLLVVQIILYYILLPFVTTFRWLGVISAPLLHLASYLFSTAILPLRLLGKFETLYIYLGVAALVGVLSGCILHLFSTVLVSIFDLDLTPEERGRSAASVRAAREQKRLDEPGEPYLSSSARKEQFGGDVKMEKRYTEWLEKDAGKRRDEGLLGQTILEEDDDSEDMF